MTLSTKAQAIYARIGTGSVKMSELRKIAKETKKDHELALELWSTGGFYPRMLATLIMDKNLLTQDAMDRLADDLGSNEFHERNQIADWLMSNQLTKSKKTKQLLESWEHHPSPILQRLFWYYQARLRWTGQTPPDNTPGLVVSLEERFASAEPEAQWAMNFLAGWVGVYEPAYRDQLIDLGERVGLYKGEHVSRGCTPNYLPEFIRIEAAKRETA